MAPDVGNRLRSARTDMPGSAPHSKRRGRRRIPPEVQRRRLIEAAERLFERHRFEDVRISDLVAEAGISSRTFYEIFGSKEDLVSEMVADFGKVLLQRLSEVFATTSDPAEHLELAVGIYLEFFERAPYDLDSITGRPGQQVRETRAHYVRAIASLIHRDLAIAHADGLIDRLADPLEIEFATTAIEGLSFRYFAEGRIRELIARKDLIAAAFRRLLL